MKSALLKRTDSVERYVSSGIKVTGAYTRKEPETRYFL